MRYIIYAILVLQSNATALASEQNDLNISGFARAVGGYFSSKQSEYQGYVDELSFQEDSLLGVQLDYRLNNYFSTSLQLLMHSGADRNSGLEWGYLTYNSSHGLQINAGRLRTPFLKYSDVIDVGFAYPWITPPSQLYSSYLFTQYDGVSARYRKKFNESTVMLEAYYGSYDDEITSSLGNYSLRVDDLHGFVFQINKREFLFRSALIRGNRIKARSESLDSLIVALQDAGFGEVATQFDSGSSAHALLWGISYNTISWYASSEWMRISSDIGFLDTVEGYYFSAGVYVDALLFHATFASSKQSAPLINNSIPLGESEQSDALYMQVLRLNDFVPKNTLDSFTLGVRWDFKTKMALKAEVSLLLGESGSSSLLTTNPNSNSDGRNATLSQVSLEWVF